VKKSIEKKLSLNKETVSNLDNRELKEIKGGTESENTCDRYSWGLECAIPSINICIDPSRDCITTTN